MFLILTLYRTQSYPLLKRDAVAAFIVFDISRHTTFEAVSKWKQDLDSKVSSTRFEHSCSNSKVMLADGSPVPCFLLANKCDTIDDQEEFEVTVSFTFSI